MCLVLIAGAAHPAYSLIIAANRDEYHRRPSRPAAFWDDRPDILGGRDMLHGGTWLAIDRHGRVAAVTNYREPSVPVGNLRSRGFLVTDFLAGGADPLPYLQGLAGRVRDYDGFNIFAGNASGLYSYGSYMSQPVPLPPGIHGISNGDLDYPWPKVTRGKHALGEAVERGASIDAEILFQILQDRAQPVDAESAAAGPRPDRSLAPIFVTGAEYGTRSSTVLMIANDGRVQFFERSFNAGGELIDTVAYQFQIMK